MGILEIIISSSLVAGVVSWLSNVWIQNLNFKQEYYKQLIARRLDAYKSVEVIIAKLSGTILIDNKHKIPLIFNSAKNLAEFYAILAITMQQSVWLTKKTESIVRDVNDELLRANAHFDLENDAEHSANLMSAGIMLQPKVHQLRARLLDQIRKDFSVLHKVSDLTDR